MALAKIFISWAGQPSKQIGDALREWLPLLFDRVDPWISGNDLEKGSIWQPEIVNSLRASSFGIVCLTPDNLTRPWALFESGAISTLPKGRVYTFLHGVEYAQVEYPLAMFNHTASDREDVWKMIQSLNKALEDQGAAADPLRSRFDQFWPSLESQLAEVRLERLVEDRGPQRDQNAMLAEVVTVVRDMTRSIGSSLAKQPRSDKDGRTIRNIILDRFSNKVRELGVPVESMSMPVEVQGGVTVTVSGKQVEVSLVDAADLADGVLKPVDFLGQYGFGERT